MRNNNYTQAIRNITHYSSKLIDQVIDMGEQGIAPLPLPGTMQHDVWMMYQCLREYERLGELDHA